MDRDELRAVQTPLKERYRDEPEAAVVTLSATGTLGEGVSCSVQTGRALAEAGLHPATGGDGSLLCSGDMLLEALVACAGVTLRAVATSLGIALRGGSVRAEGELDFRGTLGVDREAPVGFRAIRLSFALDTDADAEQLATLQATHRALLRRLPDARRRPGAGDGDSRPRRPTPASGEAAQEPSGGGPARGQPPVGDPDLADAPAPDLEHAAASGAARDEVPRVPSDVERPPEPQRAPGARRATCRAGRRAARSAGWRSAPARRGRRPGAVRRAPRWRTSFGEA